MTIVLSERVGLSRLLGVLVGLSLATASPSLAGRRADEAGTGRDTVRSASPFAAIPLGAVPPVVARFCDSRARRHKFPVLCPTRYPQASGSEVVDSGNSLLGPSFYWASFNDSAGFDDGDDGHLIFGGQRPSFSLVGLRGQLWPRSGQPRPVQQLNLPRYIFTPKAGAGRYVAQRPARILGRGTVLGRSALILVAPSYPGGGFMSDHIIVLWNWNRHGYLLSLHFNGARGGRDYTLRERVNAALAMADRFAPVAP